MSAWCTELVRGPESCKLSPRSSCRSWAEPWRQWDKCKYSSFVVLLGHKSSHISLSLPLSCRVDRRWLTVLDAFPIDVRLWKLWFLQLEVSLLKHQHNQLKKRRCWCLWLCQSCGFETSKGFSRTKDYAVKILKYNKAASVCCEAFSWYRPSSTTQQLRSA